MANIIDVNIIAAGPQGPQGMQGEKGDTGEPGPAGTTNDANFVNITDAGSLYTATTVEGALQEAMIAVNTKANKAQEAWITPTFTNGATGTLKYRKNQFGRVEFKGRLSVPATLSTAFTLPIGYRPQESVNAVCATTGGSTAFIVVFSTGLVQITGGAGATLVIDTVTYHAV